MDSMGELSSKVAAYKANVRASEACGTRALTRDEMMAVEDGISCVLDVLCLWPPLWAPWRHLYKEQWLAAIAH